MADFSLTVISILLLVTNVMGMNKKKLACNCKISFGEGGGIGNRFTAIGKSGQPHPIDGSSFGFGSDGGIVRGSDNGNNNIVGDENNKDNVDGDTNGISNIKGDQNINQGNGRNLRNNFVNNQGGAGAAGGNNNELLLMLMKAMKNMGGTKDRRERENSKTGEARKIPYTENGVRPMGR